MAGTSKHNEDVKDLMGTKILMSGIKKRKFQTIDDAADGVNNASCEKPAETGTRKRVKNRDKGKDAQPSHTDIKHRREPFRAGDPETLK